RRTPSCRMPPDTLPLHDALPICRRRTGTARCAASARLLWGAAWRPKDSGPNEWELETSIQATPYGSPVRIPFGPGAHPLLANQRSEEHTSELQSRGHLVCRLLLE